MSDGWDHRRAPAKLTVTLRVIGVRRDGYHLLDAEMVSLDLADDLWFAPGDSLEIVDGGDGHGVHEVPAGDNNLVRRALRAVERTAAVRLAKHIPAGGGLGGGSADAAAVLRWAGLGQGSPGQGSPGLTVPAGVAGTVTRSWEEEMALAARLGGDVPFCLVGGRARVRGIGEVVEPAPFVPRSFLLLMPPFGVSTARVYAAWDGLGGPTVDGANDLTPAALVVEPRLARWRDALGGATGLEPVLAGSGSTWFVESAQDHIGTDLDILTVSGVVGRLRQVRTVPGATYRRDAASGWP